MCIRDRQGPGLHGQLEHSRHFVGQLVVGVRGNGQALMGRKTGAGVVEQLGQKQSTLLGVGTLRAQHGLIFQHLLLQLQAPLCQAGNAFVLSLIHICR